MSAEPIYSFTALRNRLVVTGDLAAMTALRIGAGRASDVASNDLPVLRDALGAPFIPGASLKGAFRARIEALVRAVDIEQALDLEQIELRTREQIPSLKQQFANDDRGLSKALWEQSTLIDLTFGSPEIAGRLFFKDALVDRSLWFNQFETRNGVALNRDTETVEQGLLYDYEVVPAGTRFGFKLALENAAPWQLGMVLLGLRPWQNGEVQIGGFRSRGLGHVRLDVSSASYTTIDSVDAILSLLGYRDERTPDDTTIDLPLSRLPGVKPAPGADVEQLPETPEPLLTWFRAFRAALSNPTAAIVEGDAHDA